MGPLNISTVGIAKVLYKEKYVDLRIKNVVLSAVLSRCHTVNMLTAVGL